MPTTVVRSSSFILTGHVSLSGDAWEGDAKVTVEVSGGTPEDGADRYKCDADLRSDGTNALVIGGAVPPASVPAVTRPFNLSDDAWEGHKDVVVHINGAPVAMPRTVTDPGKMPTQPEASPARLT